MVEIIACVGHRPYVDTTVIRIMSVLLQNVSVCVGYVWLHCRYFYKDPPLYNIFCNLSMCVYVRTIISLLVSSRQWWCERRDCTYWIAVKSWCWSKIVVMTMLHFVLVSLHLCLFRVSTLSSRLYIVSHWAVSPPWSNWGSKKLFVLAVFGDRRALEI